eukprot:1041504-Pyramimonas_sp.AAC.1
MAPGCGLAMTTNGKKVPITKTAPTGKAIATKRMAPTTRTSTRIAQRKTTTEEVAKDVAKDEAA